MKKTKDFSYNLDTSNPSEENHIDNYDKEFSKIILEIRDFIKKPEIKHWKLTQVSVEFPRYQKEFVSDEVLRNLNDALNANTITEIKQQATVGLKEHSTKTPWNWNLDGSIKADGKEYYFNQFGDWTSRGLTLYELNGGFNSTYSIEYTTEDAVDISVGNFIEIPDIEMNFFSSTVDEFSNNIILPNASNILKNLGHSINPEWLSLKEAISLRTNQEVDLGVASGDNGAGEYPIKVTVVPSTLGIENNIVGEMTFIMTLKFKYSDLSDYKNKQPFSTINEVDYEKFMEELRYQINKIGYTKENAFAFSEVNDSVVTMTDLYDPVTNEKFTRDDFYKLKFNTTKTLYTFAYPGEKGQKVGVQNSAKIFIKLVRPV